MCLSRSEGPTRHERAGRETSVFAAQEPERYRLASGRLPDRLPNIALEEVDFPALGEVAVFWPSVAFVADKFDRFPSAVPIFAAVVDVPAGDVPQNDRSFEDPFQPRYIVYGRASLVNTLLPLMNFLKPCGR